MYTVVYVPVDFVCAIWSNVVNCLLKAFALSMSVVVILVQKQMLLFCCVGGFLLVINFCQDVVSRCMFDVHVLYWFVYVIVKSNDLWV